jgi:hypothetical protein
VVGVVADRRGQKPIRPVAAALGVSIANYLLLMAGRPALIVVAARPAGSSGWSWPGGLTLAVVQRSPGAPVWAVGVRMGGLFSGAIGGSLLVGVLAEHELHGNCRLDRAARAEISATVRALYLDDDGVPGRRQATLAGSPESRCAAVDGGRVLGQSGPRWPWSCP